MNKEKHHNCILSTFSEDLEASPVSSHREDDEWLSCRIHFHSRAHQARLTRLQSKLCEADWFSCQCRDSCRDSCPEIRDPEEAPHWRCRAPWVQQQKPDETVRSAGLATNKAKTKKNLLTPLLSEGEGGYSGYKPRCDSLKIKRKEKVTISELWAFWFFRFLFFPHKLWNNHIIVTCMYITFKYSTLLMLFQGMGGRGEKAMFSQLSAVFFSLFECFLVFERSCRMNSWWAHGDKTAHDT